MLRKEQSEDVRDGDAFTSPRAGWPEVTRRFDLPTIAEPGVRLAGVGNSIHTIDANGWSRASAARLPALLESQTVTP